MLINEKSRDVKYTLAYFFPFKLSPGTSSENKLDHNP